MYGLAQTTAPTAEPLTLSEVKAQLRLPIGVNQHDEYLQQILAAARQDVEDRTNRQFMQASWTLKLDTFPYCDGIIYLPRAPLSSVTSINYLEPSAGASTLWSSSNYRVATTKEPGEITLAYSATFPTTYNVSDAVTIVYVAGYASSSAVPAKAKMAILYRCSMLYDGPGKGWEDRYESQIESLRYGDEFTRYAVEAYP